jgi:16S rRNA (cytidine1402-2'-O)-methyltransferase
VLVGTPIGNLSDLSPRAVAALRAASVICCEDSRRTGRLLQHAGISGARLIVVNDHTEAERVPEVLARLAGAETVAVVTDAGTPGISDPGERLVRAAIDAGHEVSAVPGPAALVVALVTSGMATGRFVFEGFLPRGRADRAARLDELATERRTVILYEAPHRLGRTLADLAAAFGADRRIAIARELTKLHEETWRGSLGDAVACTAERTPIGEHVLVVEGAPAPPPADDESIAAVLRRHLAAGATVRDAAVAAAAELGIPKRRAYDLALADARARP